MNGVYNYKKLIEHYVGVGKYICAWGSYKDSTEQNFVYSRVTHEHAIFKRHVIDGLRVIGPFVAYACLQYLEISVPIPMKVLSAFALGYVGGKVVGEVVCYVYKLFNFLAGTFISHKYDAYGHWDFLENRRPYLGSRMDFLKCLFALFIAAVIMSIGIILMIKNFHSFKDNI